MIVFSQVNKRQHAKSQRRHGSLNLRVGGSLIQLCRSQILGVFASLRLCVNQIGLWTLNLGHGLAGFHTPVSLPALLLTSAGTQESHFHSIVCRYQQVRRHNLCHFIQRIPELIVLKEELKNALDDLRSSIGLVVNRDGEQLHLEWFYSPAPGSGAGDLAYQSNQRSPTGRLTE